MFDIYNTAWLLTRKAQAHFKIASITVEFAVQYNLKITLVIKTFTVYAITNYCQNEVNWNKAGTPDIKTNTSLKKWTNKRGN